ncbi:MAG: hypothetical protein SFU86_25210 [Pirellulaceae bacterium]|nr:hypothetical protein [Pirellulaceae bacterium]
MSPIAEPLGGLLPQFSDTPPANPPSPATPPARRAEAAAVVAGLALTVLPIAWLGGVQFGGMDGGVLSNAAWMTYLGYRPYADFDTQCPPFYFIAGWLAFALFGVRWMSLVYFAALFASITFGWHWLLLRRLPLELGWRLAIALATQALTLVPIGWGHYNQLTAIAAALFLTAALGWTARPPDWRGWLHLTFATALLSLMKPNVAGLLIACAFPIVAAQRGWFWKSCASLVVAAGMAIACMSIFGMSPVDMLRSYLGTGNRLANRENFANCLYLTGPVESGPTLCATVPLVIALLCLSVAAFANRDWLRRYWRLMALAWVGFAASFAGMCTNAEHNMVDLPVLVVGVIALTAWRQPAWLAGKWGTASLAFVFAGTAQLLLIAGFITVNRTRIHDIGAYKFWEPGATQSIQDPVFFRGVAGGPILRTVLSQVNDVLRVTDDKNTTIYFGPRMDFGYAAYGIEPPRGLPLWWTGLGEVSTAVQMEQVRRFQQLDPKVCIFLVDDYTWMPSALLEHLRDNYDLYQTGLLSVHIRKGPWRAVPVKKVEGPGSAIRKQNP